MDGKRSVRLVLVYQWLGRDIPIAEIDDASFLDQAKRTILETARVRRDMAVNLDPVLGAQEEAELKRKEKVLGLLIADREKPSTSSRRRVGAHSEGH